MLDSPISLVGEFIEVTDDVSRKHLGTYLVIGIIRKVRPGNKILPINNTYILQEFRSKRLYISYINYSPNSMAYFTSALNLRTGGRFRGYSIINTEVEDGEVDRVLALTSKEQRLDFTRRAVKHIQWRYAKLVYNEKSLFSKLPNYRKEMKRVLSPIFDPDSYIEKII